MKDSMGLSLAYTIAKMADTVDNAKKHPIFRKRTAGMKTLKQDLRGAKEKYGDKPWTKGFHELPDAIEVEPSRQLIRRALRKTAFFKLRKQYGGMERKDLKILGDALAKKTYKETPRAELDQMYLDAVKGGRA